MNKDEALFKEWELKQLEELTTYEGLENARNEGIKQGISQEKIEIARNLLEQNIDINVIIKSTGLTKEEIEDLK